MRKNPSEKFTSLALLLVRKCSDCGFLNNPFCGSVHDNYLLFCHSLLSKHYSAAACGLVCSSNLPIVPESAVFVYSSYYPLRGLIVNRSRWEQYKKHIPVTVMKCSLKNWARVRRRNEKKHYQTFCYQSFCSEFQTVLCLRHCGLRSYILFVKKSRL